MSTLPLWAYPGILAASVVLSLVLTPLALAAALRFEILDRPTPSKGHTTAVPYLGGAAIVVSFAAIVLVATAIRPPSTGLSELIAFLGLGVALALLGLADDIRGGLHPWFRLAVEAGAGAVIWAMGDSAQIAAFPGWANALVSIIWIVGVTNAFNLLDNMDGLSAGIASLTALTIFGISVLQHRYLVAALAVALAGCAAGFLWHNFHPAKIYMGDAGSLFLGFVLAVLLLKLREDAPTRVDLAAILAAPGVALFDTALVVCARTVHRRSPFLGGQDHTSHRLVRLGLSVRQAVALIYLAGIVVDGSAILMSQLGQSARIAGVVGIAVLGALAAAMLLRVPVYRSETAPHPDIWRRRSHAAPAGPADHAAPADHADHAERPEHTRQSAGSAPRPLSSEHLGS